MFGPTYCWRLISCLKGSLVKREFLPCCQQSSLVPLLGRNVRRWIVKSRSVYCRRVASALASVPPLCVVPQPFKTEDKRKHPTCWMMSKGKEVYWVLGNQRGSGGPAELWAQVMSCGLRRDLLDLENSSPVSKSSFKEVESLCVFECLASAGAQVVRETRRSAVGQEAGMIKVLRWTQEGSERRAGNSQILERMRLNV